MKAKGKHDDEGNVVRKRIHARRKLVLRFMQKKKAAAAAAAASGDRLNKRSSN